MYTDIKPGKLENFMETFYPTHYKLIIVKDLWEAYCRILLITLLKEFIKLNVNTNTAIKNVKLVELNTKVASVFLNTETL